LNRYEIKEHLDASRRTVIRTLDALAEEGFVEQDEETYHLTALGSCISESYEELTAEVSLAQRLSPFLENIPDSEFDLDPWLLEDTELVVATEGSPYALLDRTLQLREDAMRIREIAPMIEKKSTDQLARRIQEKEPIEFDAVLSEAAVEAGRSNPDYREPLRLKLAFGRFKRQRSTRT